MKKTLGMVFATVLAVCFVSCGGGSSDEEKAPALSGENLQTSTVLTSVIDTAAQTALSGTGYSVAKRSDGVRNSAKAMADSGDVDYSNTDGSLVVTGSWSGDTAELKITFKNYTASGVTLTGDVTYYVSGTDVSFTYEYNANLTAVVINGVTHTFSYQLTMVVIEGTFKYSGTYNIDGVKFSYEYNTAK